MDENELKEMTVVHPKNRITQKTLQVMRKNAESKEYNKRLAFAASCGVLDFSSRTPVALHVKTYPTHLQYIRAFKEWEKLSEAKSSNISATSDVEINYNIK